MNKLFSRSIFAIFSVLLLSGSGFMIQDAYAAADITYTAATATTTTITLTFSEAMDSSSAQYTDWTISTGQSVSSVTHTNGTTGMTLNLASSLKTDAVPTVTYAENGHLTDSAGGTTDTVVVGAVTSTDGIVPVVYAATVASPITVSMRMSESVTNDDAAIGDFTIGGVRSSPSVTVISGSTSNTLTLTLDTAIVYGDTPTITYALNGRVIDDGATGNQLAAFTNQAVANGLSKPATSDCSDCTSPELQGVKITTSSDEYVLKTGDEPIHITADVGDKVTVILAVTDNKSVDTIPFAGLYTNFEQRPSGMNLFYANNYDNNLNQISTSFYEWNVRSDDVPYDYDNTVSLSTGVPTVTNGEFLIPFTMTFNDSMESSQVAVKIYDAAGNRLHVVLPVTLEILGHPLLDFDHIGKQKVMSFFDESVLSTMVGQWSDSESDITELSTLLGIADETLPPWTTNLATWVADDRIDSADMIVAIEYLINN